MISPSDRIHQSMPATLTTSRLHLITGDSLVLRDECLQALMAEWQGPVRRLGEPADLGRIVLDLDTPSLFEPPAMWLVRCDGRYLRRHAELLAPLAGKAVVAGALVLSLPGLEPGKAGDETAKLVKALRAAEAVHEADGPDSKEMASWLTTRIAAHPQGAEDPRRVAEALIGHLGDQVDALLGAMTVIGIHADRGPLTIAGVEALVAGQASRPIWEFTGAVLEGNARRALELLHAGDGLSPQQAIAALAGEVRKLVACCDSADDGEVARWIGARGKPNLYYARQRARNLGKALLVRLLNGCLQTQRLLRRSGTDGELALETLVLHAQRLVRPLGR
jgi:DNA polymerase III delta subunit